MNDPLSLLQLQILVANRQILGDWWNFRTTSPFARLYFVLDGEGFVHHHARRFRLSPGRFYLIPPHTPARYKCTDRLEKYWVHFTARAPDGSSLFSMVSMRYQANEPAPNWGLEYLERLLQTHSSAQPRERLEADGILRILLAHMMPKKLSVPNKRKMEATQRLQPVQNYIEKNLGRAISLSDLAEVIHVHPTYFSNLFTRVMGEPVLQHINRRRIQKAQVLLWHSNVPVKWVAEKIGIPDPYYFSRLFKAKTGMNPTQYRAQKPTRFT